MKYMRIVALGAHAVMYQESQNGRDWEQRSIRSDLFEDYMERNFPNAYREFIESDTGDMTAVEYFYHYGETPEMIRKGEAYIFER